MKSHQTKLNGIQNPGNSMQDTNTLVQIEKAVLSSIIFSPSNFEDVSSILKSTDFFVPSHRILFQIIQECEKLELPFDEQILLQRSAGRINENELIEIASTNPIANIPAYTQEIKAASIRRSLRDLANTLREQSFDNTRNPQEIMDLLERELSDISLENITRSNFQSSRELVLETIKHLEELKSRGNEILTGLTTGFQELNMITTGFNKGDLIIIGARPSMGKTALVLNIAQNILNSQAGVAIFSLEMPATQLILRMLSSLTSIPLHALRRGDLTENEWSDLTLYSDSLAQKELFIDDGSMLNIAQLRSKLRRLKRHNPNVGIAIVDYLQLMIGDRNQGRQIEVSDISRGLKTLARELEIPIIALSQLSRSLDSRDDKRPILSDLRDSGAIEQDADMILFLYRDDVYKKHEDKQRLARLKKEGKEKDFKAEYQERESEPAEIIIAKNRNGETRTIHVQFNKRFTRFEEKAKDRIYSQNTETKIEEDKGVSLDVEEITNMITKL